MPFIKLDGLELFITERCVEGQGNVEVHLSYARGIIPEKVKINELKEKEGEMGMGLRV